MKVKVVNGFDGLGKRLVAIQKIRKNEILLKLTGRILTQPTRETIQIDNRKHLKNQFVDYLNHSCNPNSHVDTERLIIVADRNIKPFDDITINYLCTEHELVNPFRCNCKSSNCFNEIKGYKFLDQKGAKNHLLNLENKLKVD